MKTIQSGLAYRTGKLDHRCNLSRHECKDAQQKITNAQHGKNICTPTKSGQRHNSAGGAQAQSSQHKAEVVEYAMVAKMSCVHVHSAQYHPLSAAVLPWFRQAVQHTPIGHITYYDQFGDCEKCNVLVMTTMPMWVHM